MDPTQVVALAWQLNREHQLGGELLASLHRKSGRDGHAARRLCESLIGKWALYGEELLWNKPRMVQQS